MRTKSMDSTLELDVGRLELIIESNSEPRLRKKLLDVERLELIKAFNSSSRLPEKVLDDDVELPESLTGFASEARLFTSQGG